MLSNSWVIVRKDTGKAVLETWNKSIVDHLKPEFEALPAHEYLYKLNREIREQG